MKNKKYNSQNSCDCLNIITPVTQYCNMVGILNNGTKNIKDTELGELKDVYIENLSVNDILIYDGMNWVNKKISESLKNEILGINGSDAEGEWEEDKGI